MQQKRSARERQKQELKLQEAVRVGRERSEQAGLRHQDGLDRRLQLRQEQEELRERRIERALLQAGHSRPSRTGRQGAKLWCFVCKIISEMLYISHILRSV